MGEKRIYRPKNFENLIDKLVESGPFETKQAVMMFAAATGWHFSRERQPRGKAGEPIRWDIFERHNNDVFIHALALAESKSIEILGRDRKEDLDDPIKIFEEYATAGLEYIQDKCVDVPGDILDNLLSLIAEVNSSDREAPPGLEGLRSSDLDFLTG